MVKFYSKESFMCKKCSTNKRLKINAGWKFACIEAIVARKSE